ncbi:MAG: Rho termination factor N-terminal domain-containing protein [Pseudomonadales bacterium]
MPEKWSDKDERQYEHIRKSQQQRGKDDKRAKEIAARTINKQRREEGRTPNRSSQGTGNPNKPLEQRSKRELYNRARELNIANRSSMTKQQLVEAVRQRG